MEYNVQYYNAIPMLNSKDKQKINKGLSTIEKLGNDNYFEWKRVKPDKWAELVSVILQLIERAEDEKICSRSLVCASHLIKESELTKGQIRACVNSIQSAVKKSDKTSFSVEIEALRVIEALLNYFPKPMELLISEWFGVVLLLTVHLSPQVRRLAMHIFLERKSMLQEQESMIMYITQLKEVLVPKMKELLSDFKDIDILKLWGGIVYTLGELLHRGVSIINYLLEVMEIAFLSKSDEVLQSAFEAWKEMVDNFSLNSSIIKSPKRLQLLLKPLTEKLKAPSQDVIHAKISTWWYLADRLGPNLQDNFNLMVHPLLEFCFGQPSRSSSKSNNHCQATDYEDEMKIFLVSYGVHIVSRLCEAEKRIPLGDVSKFLILGPLKRYAPSTPFIIFTRSELFLSYATTMSSLDLPDCSKLVFYIWRCLVDFLKSNMDNDLLKKYFRAIEVASESAEANSKLLFDIIDLTNAFPAQILHKTFNSSNGELVRSPLKSTPASMLLQIILGKHVSEYIAHKKFISLFKVFTTFPITPSVLENYLSAYSLIEKAAGQVQNCEGISKMWLILTSQLITCVEECNDVNQGHNLNHDFSCVHTALILPFKQLHKWTNLSLPNKKAVWKTWDRLYLLSVKCASQVPDINYNLFTNELASKLKTVFCTPRPILLDAVESYLHSISLMLDNIRLNDASSQSSNCSSNEIEVNNQKPWLRKPTKQSFVIAPLLWLTVQVTEIVVSIDETNINNKDNSFAVVVVLFQTFEKMCNVISGNEMFHVFIELSTSLNRIFVRSLIENSFFAEARCLNKLENIWSSITQRMASYSGVYNNTMLSALSSLLTTAFKHPRKSIQTSTWTFWHSTFNVCVNKLTIPKCLQKALEELKPNLYAERISQDLISDNAFSDSPKTPISEVVGSTDRLRSVTSSRRSFFKERANSKLPFVGLSNCLSPAPEPISQTTENLILSSGDLSNSLVEHSPSKKTGGNPNQEKTNERSAVFETQLSQEPEILEADIEIVEETPLDETCESVIMIVPNEEEIIIMTKSDDEALKADKCDEAFLLTFSSPVENKSQNSKFKIFNSESTSSVVSDDCQIEIHGIPVDMLEKKQSDNGSDDLVVNSSCENNDIPIKRKRGRPKRKQQLNLEPLDDTGAKRRRVSRNILLDTNLNSSLLQTRSKMNSNKSNDINVNADDMTVDDVANVMNGLTPFSPEAEECLYELNSTLFSEKNPNVETKTDIVAEELSAINANNRTSSQETVDAAVLPSPCDIQPFPVQQTSSPISSPGGILKKQNNDSPRLSKAFKRVSFADPPVQDTATSDYDRNSPLRGRSQRLLNKRNALFDSPRRKEHFDLLSPDASQNSKSAVKDSSELMAEFGDCLSPVSTLFPYLALVSSKGFSQLLNSKSIFTVGDFCKLTKAQIQEMPIQHPKIKVASQALMHFKASLSTQIKEQTQKPDPEIISKMDFQQIDNYEDVEAKVEELHRDFTFGDLDNKDAPQMDIKESVPDFQLDDGKIRNDSANILEGENMNVTILEGCSMEGQMKDEDTQTHVTDYKSAETQTHVKLNSIEIQTNESSTTDQCSQTAKSSQSDCGVQISVEMFEAKTQTNPGPTLKNGMVQTNCVILKEVNTETDDLIGSKDVECQIQVQTKDAMMETTREVKSDVSTQTRRGISCIEEDPFHDIFSNFCATLLDVEDHQLRPVAFDHIANFHQNMLTVMNNFVKRWYPTNHNQCS